MNSARSNSLEDFEVIASSTSTPVDMASLKSAIEDIDNEKIEETVEERKEIEKLEEVKDGILFERISEALIAGNGGCELNVPGSKELDEIDRRCSLARVDKRDFEKLKKEKKELQRDAKKISEVVKEHNKIRAQLTKEYDDKVSIHRKQEEAKDSEIRQLKSTLEKEMAASARKEEKLLKKITTLKSELEYERRGATSEASAAEVVKQDLLSAMEELSYSYTSKEEEFQLKIRDLENAIVSAQVDATAAAEREARYVQEIEQLTIDRDSEKDAASRRVYELEKKIKSLECSLKTAAMAAAADAVCKEEDFKRKISRIQAAHKSAETAATEAAARKDEQFEEKIKDLKLALDCHAIDASAAERREAELKKEIKILEDALVVARAVAAKHEAAAAQAAALEMIPPPPADVKSEVTSHTFRLRISQASNFEDCKFEFTSKPVRIAGVDWVVKLQSCMKMDAKKKKEKQYLGVFLKAVAESLPEKWSCCVKDSYSLHSQTSDSVHKLKFAKSPVMFNTSVKSWGFDDFISLKDLFKPTHGYVKDGAILLSAEVTVFPTEC